LARLTKVLEGQFAESEKLEDTIRNNLKRINLG